MVPDWAVAVASWAGWGVEQGVRAFPFGDQLWNFGQDVNERNWQGAAGGATAGILQALLMDAFARGKLTTRAETTPSIGSQARVAAVPRAPVPQTATPSGPLPVPVEEVAVTPQPAADISVQPSESYGRESSTSVSKPTSSSVHGQRPPTLKAQKATSANYRETFFEAHPELRGKVWVHHAFPQRAAELYPYVKIELHALENLRGIPNEINAELHLKQINSEWRTFYKEYPHATEAQIRAKIAEIDAKYGERFLPPKGK